MPIRGLPGDITRVEKIISNALDAPLEYFALNGWQVTAPEGGTKRQTAKTDRYTSENDKGQGVRMRLDWELAEETLVNTGVTPTDALGYEASVENRKLILELMKQQSLVDLTDLAINGDYNNSKDALLKACDGERARGQFLGSAEITSAMVYAESKPRKEVIEFTMYLNIVFNFD